MKTIELIEEKKLNYFLREAFNTLRTNVLFCGKSVKTIVVTSCFAHEGKSTISFEMSRSLAEAGKKVLLVDADLRKSVMVTKRTKQRGVYGLSQLLSGQVSNDDAIYHTQYEGFDLVFTGPFPPNPTELVGSPAFKEFLDSQRPNYDYIIIDAAPLGLVIDAAVMASVCDGSILVMDTGKVKFRTAQNVKSQLEKSGCKILGVVLNQTARKRTAKKDAYYKSYYSSYEASAQHAQNVAQKQAASNAAPQPMKQAPRAPQTGVRPTVSGAPRPMAPRPTAGQGTAPAQTRPTHKE